MIPGDHDLDRDQELGAYLTYLPWGPGHLPHPLISVFSVFVFMLVGTRAVLLLDPFLNEKPHEKYNQYSNTLMHTYLINKWQPCL